MRPFLDKIGKGILVHKYICRLVFKDNMYRYSIKRYIKAQLGRYARISVKID